MQSQNLEIVNRLYCCYKHVSGTKTKFKNVFRNLLCNICPAEIDEGQIIVTEGNFLRGGSPCEVDELYPEAYNIAEVDENYKDFLLFRSMNYKCTLKVQEFVNEQGSIKRCPVCKGISFFTEGENAKDKLLSIISNSIADGNQTVKLYNDEIILLQKKIRRLNVSYVENVWKQFQSSRELLQKKINESIQLIIDKLDEIIDCNEKMKTDATQREKSK